jgi:hypothetical protein
MLILKNRIVYLLLICLLIILFDANLIFPENRTQNLQSFVLDDFELTQDGKPKRLWVAVPNKFGRKNSKEAGESLQKLSWIESWPEAYFGKDGVLDEGNVKKEYKHCLALFIAFNRQGYNTIELFPLEEKNGKLVRSPIPLNGIVKQVDLWIWGANYLYEMEMVLRDYRGVEYRLPIGSIKHVGWKNFNIPIPSYIQQTGTYILGQYQFSLVKLVLWTTPKEKVSGTYVYIDHMKYLTDIYDNRYDGYELGKIETVRNLWEKAPKAPDDKDVIKQ